MIFLNIFVLFFLSFTNVFSTDDNTLLPSHSTLQDKQQKIRFALAKNRGSFNKKISDLHLSSIDAPTLIINPPSTPLGRTTPQSYFNTSDMRIVNYYFEKIIGYALENPPRAVVTTTSLNNIIIECDLGASGDLPQYFLQPGFGKNVMPDPTHPQGGFTNTVRMVVQKKASGWEFASCYPFGYN